MNIARSLVSLVAVALVVGAGGCRVMPVKEVQGHTIAAGSGKALSMDQIAKAIVQGASYRGWVMKAAAPGKMVGTLEMHDKQSGALKHLVVVDVSYTSNAYDIRYRSSENLKHDPATGKIHGSYNRWIDNLVMSIDAALRAL